MTDIGHNSGFAAKELIRFVERIERVTEEIEAIQNDRKEIFEEAKDKGFDTKIMRKVIALRRLDSNDRREMESLIELYMGTLDKHDADVFAKSVKEAGE